MSSVTPAPRAAIVFNPVKVDEARLRRVVAAEEKRTTWAPSLWLSTQKDEPGQLAARRARDEGVSVVIAAGGDGTVRAVAEELRGGDIPLALAPAGTGNLLARNLRLTLNDLDHSIRVAFAGSDRRIDIATSLLRREDGSTASHAFLVMAGIGLDAQMATGTNEDLKGRIGWLAYADPIARSVLSNQQFGMRYRLDEHRQRSMRAHTVIVGNCGTLTANILLLPEAVVDDGLLDVVVMRPPKPSGWARIGSRLALNRFLHRTRGGRWILKTTPELDSLQYAQATSMEAWFEAPQDVELDGDSFGAAIGVTLRVEADGLLIRVPNEL